VIEALRRGFEETLGTHLSVGHLTVEEDELARRYLPGMQSEEHIFALRHGEATRGELRSIWRAPGGLIRATLVVDQRRRRLKSALITGDFFAFPKRAIFDLEARLKDAPAEAETIAMIIERLFADVQPTIPGIEHSDVLKVIQEALRKMDYPSLGIPSSEVNSIFTVVEPFENMPPPSALLLPYCAKYLECELRFSEGCLECGMCGVGEAFALARKHGLRPITIQNYEHLEETLQSCVDQGIKGFVGCCCEAFLAKHREDFERIGLPGILVDLDNVTCYDLGQEDAAHHGRFDRMTRLKLGLLEKVIESGKNGSSAI
jgi:lipoate-protein ligase A